MGNVKLEEADMAGCISLTSCLENVVKSCQALVEAFAIEVNIEMSAAFKSEPNHAVEEQKLTSWGASAASKDRDLSTGS